VKTRGVTRLGGARGKKQVWRPNVLYWRKYLWPCWDFSAPLQRLGAGGILHPLFSPRYAPGGNSAKNLP